MSKAKRNALFFLSAAGILVLVLAMSLPTLSLSSGKSFSLGKSDVVMPGVGDEIPGSEAFLWIVRGILALSFIMFPFYVVYSLLSAAGRRQLVQNLIILALLFWLANYLDKHPPGDSAPEQEIAAGSSASDLGPSSPSAVFSEEEAPSWLAAVVILLASACGVAVLGAGVWFFRQRMALARSSLSPLAEAAQETIESLQSGGDFKTAIIRCYHEMNRVVKEERGLAREATMTPREFEAHLVSRGLPPNAVETLTRLFEQVRYGSLPSRTDDETLAFACLTEIVNTCQAQGSHGES